MQFHKIRNICSKTCHVVINYWNTLIYHLFDAFALVSNLIQRISRSFPLFQEFIILSFFPNSQPPPPIAPFLHLKHRMKPHNGSRTSSNHQISAHQLLNPSFPNPLKPPPSPNHFMNSSPFQQNAFRNYSPALTSPKLPKSPLVISGCYTSSRWPIHQSPIIPSVRALLISSSTMSVRKHQLSRWATEILVLSALNLQPYQPLKMDHAPGTVEFESFYETLSNITPAE